jgi:hypothetical protein
VESEYPKMQAGGERWQRVADAIHRIIGGERDAERLAMGMDRETGFIIHTILARLSGEAAPTPPAARAAPPPPAGEGPGPSAPALAELRRQWAPVVDAVIMVAQDGAPVPPDLAAFLDRMGASDDWRALVAVLRRILAGERDPAALLPGLDATDTVIAGEVLRGLGVDVDTPPLSGTGPGEGSQQAMGLEDLFDMVAQACQPNAPPQLGEQLYGLTQQLARDPRLPAEIQALGRVLNRILCGEREPDLSALPPELAQAVERLLAAIPS